MFEALIEAPWWLGVAIAATAFVGLRWVGPALIGEQPILQGFVMAMRLFAPWVTGLFLFAALLSALRAWLGRDRRRTRLDRQTSIESIRELSWPAFEALVGEAYRRIGYSVEERGGAAPDGGVDLVLHRAEATTLVQCKHWKKTQVGVAIARELYGVVMGERASAGILVTSGAFTTEAMAFAHGKPLELVDGPQLLSLVGAVQRERRITASGNKEAGSASAAPVLCPMCGASMVRRIAKRGGKAGQAFWGCSRYPGCRGVRSGA